MNFEGTQTFMFYLLYFDVDKKELIYKVGMVAKPDKNREKNDMSVLLMK